MTRRDVGTLNSLVTFAAENIPGGLNSDERRVAKIVGSWVLDGTVVVQLCPHCLAIAPEGDDRQRWLQRHTHNKAHRAWQGFKSIFS